MSVSNGQLANATTFNTAFVSKTSDSTVTAKITQEQESILKEIATPSTPSSGYGKIYFKSDGKLYQLNDAGVETQVGTGSGAAGKNFITNGDAEGNATTGWAVYADAAGTSPVDGTGGTANVTNTVSSSSPIFGAYSFLLAKDAVNRQGQGWSYAFTIDSGYKAKVLEISFDYLVSSGTFVAGSSTTSSDVTVWIYDVTNAVLIQPSNHKLFSNSGSISETFTGSFQTASNSTSYRLIFHVGSTSASAYTLKVDNISVSPAQYAYGTPVTDWQSYTPTVTYNTGGATNVTHYGRYRRVGDSLELLVSSVFSGTSAAFTRPIYSLPAGLTIDTTKLMVSNYGAVTDGMIGSARANNSVTNAFAGGSAYNSTTSFFVHVFDGSLASVGYREISETVPFTFDNGDSIEAIVRVPISGWSSSVQTSDSADQRVVAFRASQGAAIVSGTLSVGDALIKFTSVSDSHGAYSATTGLYTVPVSGFYIASTGLGLTGSGTNGYLTLKISKNAGADQSLFPDILIGAQSNGVYATGSCVMYCNAGDTLTVYAESNFTTPVLDTTPVGFFCVNRISGPSAITTTETVAMRAVKNSGSNTTSGTPQLIGSWTSAVFDTHGMFNLTTGLATIPVSGTYQISTVVTFAANATGQRIVQMRKNSIIEATTNHYDTYADKPSMIGSMLLKCAAGDTIDLLSFQNSGGSLNYDTAQATATQLNIVRVGI